MSSPRLTRIVEWLLDLDQIRLGRDAPLLLQWNLPVQRWVLFAGAIMAACLIVWTYLQEHGKVWQRALPALLRGALIVLVAAMLCAPVLVLQRNRVEPSHVAILIDRSQSMGRKDVYLDVERAETMNRGAGLASPSELADTARIDLVRQALARDDGAAVPNRGLFAVGVPAALRALWDRHEVQLLTFADSARLEAEIPVHSVSRVEGARDQARRSLWDAGLAALNADGTATDIPTAVQAVLRGRGAGPIAAVVVISDGQSTEPSTVDDAIDAARAAQVPVYTVPVGSLDPPRDVTVGPVVADETVFVKDLLAIRARLTAAGLTESTPVEVSLVQEEAGQAGGPTGTTLTTQTVHLGGSDDTAEIELRTKPTRPGRIRYRIEAAPLTGEIELANNVDRIDVTVIDDHLRLLYVEGYPRFDYRYIKNAFLREPTIRFSALLLSADRDFAQEGTEPIRRFPETPDELNQYDVVLFGDVDPTGDWLTPAQMDMLVDLVGQRGGGFGLIAGERSAPQRFRGTPLERLIPVRIDPEFLGHYDTTLTAAFQPQLTIEGRHHRLFRFDADPAVSDRIFEGLPGWFWMARTLGPRPGAEVLLEHPTLQSLAGPMPLAVIGRYGAGRTFFQASDDTWRWRHHTGELLLDTYWVQVARSLLSPAGRRQVGVDRRLTITPEQAVYPYGARCVIRVEVQDEQTLATLEAAPTLMVSNTDDVPIHKIKLDRLGPTSRQFEAIFVPPTPGTFVITSAAVAPPPGQRPAAAFVRVESADVERRQPEADDTLLLRLAEQTGGEVIPLDGLPDALAGIRDRSIRIPDDISEPLWDSKLVLILFVLIIGTEWVLRKAFGML